MNNLQLDDRTEVLSNVLVHDRSKFELMLWEIEKKEYGYIPGKIPDIPINRFWKNGEIDTAFI